MMSEFQVGQTVRVKPDAEFRNNTMAHFVASDRIGVIRKIGHDPDGYLVSVGLEPLSAIADLFNADELTPADPPPAVQPGEDGRIAEMRESLHVYERISRKDAEWLLERLDAVTKRAERRRVALEPFARLYEEALPTRWANHASDSVIYAFNDAELTLDDFKEAHRYARKESTDG